MLSVSDGYWGFVHQKRFYRFCYAALTFFAIFSLVAAFFKVGAGTRFDSQHWREKLALDKPQLEENERMLRWIYVFYPTPLIMAWFVVYFGKFLYCWRIKRLRKARNYKYNLLLASFAAAVLLRMRVLLWIVARRHRRPQASRRPHHAHVRA
ncbi:hypothetical protein PINS_up010165 [Pythium insidiosum]|nr:hypothetical protein PINS_up010165 [Pythium insidiosum]